MVVQKTVDKLKAGTHDEKHAAASVAAAIVVFVLFLGWGYFFLRNLKENPLPQIDTSAIPEDLYDTRALRQLEQVGQESYGTAQQNQLEMLRESAAAQEAGTNAQVEVSNENGYGTAPGDSFGVPLDF